MQIEVFFSYFILFCFKKQFVDMVHNNRMAVGGNLIPILRLSSKHKLETITIKIHAGGAGLTLLFCISSL